MCCASRETKKSKLPIIINEHKKSYTLWRLIKVSYSISNQVNYMNTIKILSIILFSLNIAQAQIIDTLNQEASPKGGINQLAIKYYGIEFTKEQRASLNR